MKKFIGVLLVFSAVLLLTVACQMGESADEAIVVGRGLYEEKDFAEWANRGGYAFLRNDLYLTESYVLGWDDKGTLDENDDTIVTTPYTLDLRGHKLIFCDSSSVAKETGVEKKTAKKPAKAKVTVPATASVAITNSEPESEGTGIESISTNNGSEETKLDNGTLFDIQGGKLAIEDTPIKTDGGGDPVIIVSGGGDLDIKKSSIVAEGDPSGADGTKAASPVLQVEALPDKGEDTGDGGQTKKSEINLDETEIVSNTTPVNIVPDPDAGKPAEGKSYVAPEISFKGGSTVKNTDKETDKSPINNEVGAKVEFEQGSKIVIEDGGNCPQEEKSGTNTREGGFYRMKNDTALKVTGKTTLTLSNYTIVSSFEDKDNYPVKPTIIVDGTDNDTDSPTTLILDNCLVLGEGTAIEVKGNALLVTGVNQGESYGTDTPDSYSATTTNINVQNGTLDEYIALDTPVEKDTTTEPDYLTGTGILVSGGAKAVLANANVHIGLPLGSTEKDTDTYLYGASIPNVGVTSIGGNVELRDNINISNAAIAMNITSGSTVTDNTTEDHVLKFEGSEHAWYVKDSTIGNITKIDFISHNNHAFTAYGSEIGDITDCTFTQDATTDNEDVFAINLGSGTVVEGNGPDADDGHTSVGVISHTMAGDKDTNVYDSESTLYPKAPVIEVTKPTISGPNGICLDYANIKSIQNEWINVTGNVSGKAYDGIALNNESYISMSAYDAEVEIEKQTTLDSEEPVKVVVFSDAANEEKDDTGKVVKNYRSVVKVTLPEKGLGNAVSFAPGAESAAGASFQNSEFTGGKKSFDVGNYAVNNEVVGLYLKDCYAKAADYCLYADTTSDIQINGGEFIVINDKTNNAPLYMTSNLGNSSRLTLDNGIVLFPDNIGINAVKSRPGVKLSSMRSDKTSAIKVNGGIVNIKPETLIYSTGASAGVDYYIDVAGAGRVAIGNEVEFWGANGHDHLHTSAAHYDGWYNYYYYLSYTKPWVSTEARSKLHARHVVAAGVGGGGVVVAVTVYGQVINDQVDTTVWATVEDWTEIPHEVTERHDGSFKYNADLTRHYFKVNGGYDVESVYGEDLEYENGGYLSKIAVYYDPNEPVGTPGKIKVGSQWYTNDFEETSFQKSADGSYDNPLGLYTFLGAANGGYFCAGAVECVYDNQTSNYVYNEETQSWEPFKDTTVVAPKYVITGTSGSETPSLTCDTNGAYIYYRDVTNANTNIPNTYNNDTKTHNAPTYPSGTKDLGPYILYDANTILKIGNKYEFFAIKFPDGYKAPKFILDEYTGSGKVTTSKAVAAIVDGEYRYDASHSTTTNNDLFYYFSKYNEDNDTFLILREKDAKGNYGPYNLDENIKQKNLTVGGVTYPTPGALCDWRMFYLERDLVDKTYRQGDFVECGEVLASGATPRRGQSDTFNLRNGATVGRSEVVVYTMTKDPVDTPVASFAQGRYLTAGVSTKDATMSYMVILDGISGSGENNAFVKGTDSYMTEEEIKTAYTEASSSAWTPIGSTESKDLLLSGTATSTAGIPEGHMFGSNFPDLRAYVVVKASKDTMEDSYKVLTLDRTPQPVIGTVERDDNSGALSVTVSSPTVVEIDEDEDGTNDGLYPAAGSYTLGYVYNPETVISYKSDASSGKISKAGDKITGTVAIPDTATGNIIVQAYLLNNSNALPSAVNTRTFVRDAAPTVETALYLAANNTCTRNAETTFDYANTVASFYSYSIKDINTGEVTLYYLLDDAKTYSESSSKSLGGYSDLVTINPTGTTNVGGSVKAYSYGGEGHIPSVEVSATGSYSVSIAPKSGTGDPDYIVVPIPEGYVATVYGNGTYPASATITTSLASGSSNWGKLTLGTDYEFVSGSLKLPILEVSDQEHYPTATVGDATYRQTYYKVVLTKIPPATT